MDFLDFGFVVGGGGGGGGVNDGYGLMREYKDRQRSWDQRVLR